MSKVGSIPVFPPKITKKGLLYVIVWPYLLPGVTPITGTITHYEWSCPFFKSKRNKSSEDRLPPKIKYKNFKLKNIPPLAPPYIIIYPFSTAVLAWAALGEGCIPMAI